MHRTLNIAFERRKVEKHYHALTEGIPDPPSGEITLPLAPVKKGKNIYKIDPKEGKPAITRYTTVKQWIGYALLDVQPITGRPHQIRVHLRAIGTPIVGDVLYGGHYLYLSRLKPKYRKRIDEDERPLIERTALHAARLTVPRTEDGTDTITFEAPYFKDMEAAMRALDRWRSYPTSDL